MVLLEYDVSSLSLVERNALSKKFDCTEEFSNVENDTLKIFTNHPDNVKLPSSCKLKFQSGSPDNH